MTDAELLAAISEILSQTGSSDAAALERVIKNFERLLDRISGDIDALILLIEKLAKDDELTRSAIARSKEFNRLLEHALAELEDYMISLRTDIRNAAQDGIDAGVIAAIGLIATITAGGIDVATPSSPALIELMEIFALDGPLMAKIAESAPLYVQQIQDFVLDAVALGKNPKTIANDLEDMFGLPLTDAMRWMRTAQLYSYRQAAMQTYRENDVVDSWMWYAELDDAVCISCAAEHGTIHDLDEDMDSHYNCRCVAIPYIAGLSPDVQTGEEWFENLSEEEQEALMGGARFRAWQDGAVEFSQFSTTTEDEIFGTMRGEASLVSILGEDAQKYYAVNQ